MKRYDFSGTGSMCVDHFVRTPRIVGPDEKVLLEPSQGEPIMRTLVGGVTLNHLGWARTLGLRVALFGKQADDPGGRFLRAGMDRLGIEHHLDLRGSASSFAQILVDMGGGRSIYMSRAATGELTPADIDERFRDVIESSAVVSSEVSQVPLTTVRRVLERARAAGARTVLDVDVPLAEAVPSLGTREDLEAVLSLADVLKPSHSAGRGLVEGSPADPEALARSLVQRYRPQAVVVTLGADGALLLVGGQLSRVPAPHITVVDSTGAGDAFLGGLVAGLHYGLSWVDAALLGSACGAVCCEQLGAFPEQPSACRERALHHYRALGGRPVPISAVAPVAAPPPLVTQEFLATARAELERVARDPGLGTAITRAAALVHQVEASGGRVHVTGIGKPEYVARYAAGLLASTGTPSTFLHGTEAIHGSIGQLRAGDLLIAISNSGETPELLSCVAAARGMGARILAVTGQPESNLAKGADAVLTARVEREGGPLELAPRSSILAEVLVISALSVELQAARDFNFGDYHRRHPAGALGRRARDESG